MSRRCASLFLWLSGLKGFETFQCCVDEKCHSTYVRHIVDCSYGVFKLNTIILIKNGNRHDYVIKSNMPNKTNIELYLTFISPRHLSYAKPTSNL